MLSALKKRGGSLEKQQKTKFEQKGVILAEIKEESLELLEVRNIPNYFHNWYRILMLSVIYGPMKI